MKFNLWYLERNFDNFPFFWIDAYLNRLAFYLSFMTSRNLELVQLKANTYTGVGQNNGNT